MTEITARDEPSPDGPHGVEPCRRTAPRRGLALGAAITALSAVAGSIGLVTGGLDPDLVVTSRLPWQSPVLGGIALIGAVALPFAALAAVAWDGRASTGRLATAAGWCLVAWIVIQVAIIRTFSFFQPMYLAVGLAFVVTGPRHPYRH